MLGSALSPSCHCRRELGDRIGLNYPKVLDPVDRLGISGTLKNFLSINDTTDGEYFLYQSKWYKITHTQHLISFFCGVFFSLMVHIA